MRLLFTLLFIIINTPLDALNIDKKDILSASSHQLSQWISSPECDETTKIRAACKIQDSGTLLNDDQAAHLLSIIRTTTNNLLRIKAIAQLKRKKNLATDTLKEINAQLLAFSTHQDPQIQIKALKYVWRDKPIRKAHYQQFEKALCHLATFATPDIKAQALILLWNKKKYKNAHKEGLLRRMKLNLSNVIRPTIRARLLGNLLYETERGTKENLELVEQALTLAENTATHKSSLLSLLWVLDHYISEGSALRARLLPLQMRYIKAHSGDCSISVLSEAAPSALTHEIYRAEILALLWPMARGEKGPNLQYRAIELLWEDKKIQPLEEAELTQLLDQLLQNSEGNVLCETSEFCLKKKILSSDKRQNLFGKLYALFKTTVDDPLCYRIFYMLIDDDEPGQIYAPRLIADIFSENSRRCGNSFYLKAYGYLTDNFYKYYIKDHVDETELKVMIAHTYQIFNSTSDKEERSKAAKMLWANPQARARYRNALLPIFKDIAQHASSDWAAMSAFEKLLDDKEYFRQHRDELLEIFLKNNLAENLKYSISNKPFQQFWLNAGVVGEQRIRLRQGFLKAALKWTNLEHDVMALGMLMNDDETASAIQNEVTEIVLKNAKDVYEKISDFLRNDFSSDYRLAIPHKKGFRRLYRILCESPDICVQFNALDKLWHDEAVQGKDRDFVVDAYLAILRSPTTDDQYKLAPFFKLWNHDTSFIVHQAELNKYVVDPVSENPIFAMELTVRLGGHSSCGSLQRRRLEKLLLDIAETHIDQKRQVDAVYRLTYIDQTKYRHKLIPILRQIIATPQSEDILFDALTSLSKLDANNLNLKNEIIPPMMQLGKEGKTEQRRHYALRFMYNNYQEHREEVTLTWLDLAETTKDKELQTGICSDLCDNESIRSLYGGRLIPILAKLIAKKGADYRLSTCVDKLWQDYTNISMHKDLPNYGIQLIDLYLALYPSMNANCQKSILMKLISLPDLPIHAIQQLHEFTQQFVIKNPELKETEYLLLHLYFCRYPGMKSQFTTYIKAYWPKLDESERSIFREKLFKELPAMQQLDFYETYVSFFTDNNKEPLLLSLLRNPPTSLQLLERLLVITQQFMKDHPNYVFSEMMQFSYGLFKSQLEDELKNFFTRKWSITTNYNQEKFFKHLCKKLEFDEFLTLYKNYESLLDDNIKAYVLRLLLTDFELEPQEVETLLVMSKEFIQKASPESAIGLLLACYLHNATRFQDEFDNFMAEKWATLNRSTQENEIQKLIDKYGEEHPVVQEMLLLYAQSGNGRNNAMAIYANLLRKLKSPHQHNPSRISITLDQPMNRTLGFEINPEILTHLPTSQEALATLEDVTAILGPNGHGLMANTEFTGYFKAPFTEEGLMLQAMVKRCKTMGEMGQQQLRLVMDNMEQCKQGKNHAIWEYYAIASEAVPMASLKDVTDWWARLNNQENPPVTQEMMLLYVNSPREDFCRLFLNMLKKNHVFRQHLTELSTPRAQLLKALLGALKSKEWIDITIALHALSDASKFDTQLDTLCAAYGIGLPASKFGESLSPEAIENLIQQLTSTEVEFTGPLSEVQNNLRLASKNPEFLALLSDFENPIGAQLRELIQGYVQNGWGVGLLKLMLLAQETSLPQAVEKIYAHTRIDKDIPLTWDGLNSVIKREMLTLKTHALNRMVEKLTKQKYGERPHDFDYLKGLLGGIVGLRPANKKPSMDKHVCSHKDVTALTLEEALDFFHKEFTPLHLVEAVNNLLIHNKLSIVDPHSGQNIIWKLLSQIAKAELQTKGINDDIVELDDLIYEKEKNKGATQLAICLLLTKLGILREVELAEESRD